MKNILIHIGFWAFLPISALQGLWLRHSATRLPEAKGDRIGVNGLGKPLHLLAMGDSIIAGVGTGTMEYSLPVQFANALAKSCRVQVHWRVEGKNGADISQLRQNAGRIEADQKADVILISIGVNDVTGLSSAQHWSSELQRLLLELRSKWPLAGVIVLGLPPMSKFPLPPQPLRFTLGLRAATFDSIAGQLLANHANMLHVPTRMNPIHHDFCEDGFHPSAKACRFWAEELAQMLKNDTLTV